MNASNILAWSLQIAVLVTAAGLASWLLQLRVPRARLLYWQVTLAACLVLPLVRPWTQDAISSDVSVTTVGVARVSTASHSFHLPLEQAVLWLIAAGILTRIIWLAAGFVRLRQYRRRSSPVETREGVALLISEEIASPVTFGVVRPVVLLPTRFPSLDARAREAILCHELLHIRRRDWVFAVAEELVRAVFWFHPAVWWLLGQIQLTREQTVDREVIDRTQTREEYIDSLLVMAGGAAQLDLAPAPLFLRKRHLKQRVVALVKEVRMSKTRLYSSLAAAFSVLAVACWLATAVFPLAAAPAEDAPGVTVDLNGATLLHRSAVAYPDSAREHGVQGTVVVQVKIDGSGNVADAQVLSGPEELRKAVLESVLNWHFTHNLAGTTTQATLTFHLETGEVHTVVKREDAPVATAPPAVRGQAVVVQRSVKSLQVTGLSDAARTDLLSTIPVHEGDTITPETLRQLAQVVKNFDEHLQISVRPVGDQALVQITLAPPLPPPPPPPLAVAAAPSDGTPRIRVGGTVQASKLFSQPKPTYPPLAKQAHIQGAVQLLAVIAKDGSVEDLKVISGHPLLVPAALDAVKQWVYQPTLLNGAPTEVETEIDVNFTLAQ